MAKSPSAQPQQISFLGHCLQPIADGLQRLTDHCWDIVFRRGAENADEEKLKVYLRVDDFRRWPSFAVERLFNDNHLDAGLDFLKIHESPEFAKDLEKRLRDPLDRLAKLEGHACRILAYDYKQTSKSVTWWPYPFEELKAFKHFYCRPAKRWKTVRKSIDGILDSACMVKNEFRAAAQSLHRFIPLLREKHKSKPTPPPREKAQPSRTNVTKPRCEHPKLYLGSKVLLDYKRKHAPEQEKILAAFQKAGWPQHVGVVVMTEKEKHKLPNALKNLIRKLGPNAQVTFKGDGSGLGVIFSM